MGWGVCDLCFLSIDPYAPWLKSVVQARREHSQLRKVNFISPFFRESNETDLIPPPLKNGGPPADLLINQGV